MAFDASSARLFGLDLGKIWRSYRQGLREALAWPVFSWLEPVQPVAVLGEDGCEQLCDARTGLPLPTATCQNAVRAVLLPEEFVLRRQLRLPDLCDEDLLTALNLHAVEHAPFPLEELVLGWRKTLRDDGMIDVDLAFTARLHVEQYLRERNFDPVDPPEVWVSTAGPALVLRGFGEQRRARSLRRQRVANLAALLVFFLACIALLVTPFLLKRAQIFDAQARYAALSAQTAQSVAQREALVRAASRVRVLSDRLSGRADLSRMLAQLTRALPDTAYLTQLEVAGTKVRIVGAAENAAALVERLAAQPGFLNVKTPSAISRSADGRETFSIEFTLGLLAEGRSAETVSNSSQMDAKP